MGPNAHLKNIGNASAQRGINECLQMAENSGVAKSDSKVVKRGAECALALAEIGNWPVFK